MLVSMTRSKWQVSCFLQGQILQFSMIVIFTVFWDLMQRLFEECNVWKCRGQQDRRTYSTCTMTDELWSFVKFEEQFNKSENFNDTFYFRESKKNDFLGISFLLFLFLIHKKVFSAVFCIFRFVLNFCDFSVFSLSQKTCHSRLDWGRWKHWFGAQTRSVFVIVVS